MKIRRNSKDIGCSYLSRKYLLQFHQIHNGNFHSRQNLILLVLNNFLRERNCFLHQQSPAYLPKGGCYHIPVLALVPQCELLDGLSDNRKKKLLLMQEEIYFE